MPERKTRARAQKARRQGKAPSSQAGEYVREEMQHIRKGRHGARSAKQAVAIGLSKARREGVALPPPKRGKTSARTRKSAEYAAAAGRRGGAKKTSPKRAQAVRGALKREGRAAATPKALARQARSAAQRRSPAERSAAAKKAARTKGPAVRSAAARKAARTRSRRT
ncbi:MAG: DUF6496 domain-containing protein [Myxococcota bacterium]